MKSAHTAGGFLRNDRKIGRGEMDKMKNYYVYITTNPGKTTLYTGVTSDLVRRIWQHYLNRGNRNSFAGKYYCYNLIYYEHFYDIHQAIHREKEIKNMSRYEKKKMIDIVNPDWRFRKLW